MMTSTSQQVLDRFVETGRNHPYLAFTVNSICDLDCVFCKPRCMEDYGPKDTPLSVGDFAEIARVAGRWGVRKAHLSGGEPTLRKDILGLIDALRAGLGTEASIGITSHGNLRRSLSVSDLAAAGLTYLNISLHSLDPDRSSTIMGGGHPQRSLESIDLALARGLKVKVNCVLQRSYLADALAVVKLAQTRPIAVRLIELQEIGPAVALFPTEFISEAEVREHLSAEFAGASELSRASLGVRSPGQYLVPSGWTGSVGFISNSSCATCSDANRIKITPTGVARPCILHNRDVELRRHIDEGSLDPAFEHLFGAMLERNNNPAWNGYHYVDYDLRWDRVDRPKGARILPLAMNSGGKACARTARGEDGAQS
jgi:cyclic pyranopterin phosphate synthase